MLAISSYSFLVPNGNLEAESIKGSWSLEKVDPINNDSKALIFMALSENNSLEFINWKSGEEKIILIEKNDPDSIVSNPRKAAGSQKIKREYTGNSKIIVILVLLLFQSRSI